MIMPRLRSFLKNSHGAAGAEMALVLPMLFALIFTTWEGGNYLWSEHKVVKGVRDGARYAGRLPFSDYDCPPGGGTGSITSDAETRIKLLTRTGTLDQEAKPTVSGWGDDPNDVTITVNCLAPDAADPDGLASNGIYVSNPSGAPRVTVSANVEYPSLFGALGFDTSAARLKSVAVSAVMGI